MSWNFAAMGKAPAVLKAIKAYEEIATASPMMEPEQSIREAALSIAELAVGAMSPDIAVSVSAQGSQSSLRNPDTGAFDRFPTNNLKLEIQPVYGFVE